MAETGFRTVSLMPLLGVLDVRSRPAETPIGGFRWKQNWQTTTEAKLCRRQGFTKAFGDVGTSFTNQDHHSQGPVKREEITFLFESTSNDGVRTLFDGTQSRISKMNISSGVWTDIATGKGASGSRWHAAELQDKVVFTNNVDDVLIHTLGTNTTSTIPELINAAKVRKAKVVLEFLGVIILMNVERDGVRRPTEVVWSNLNDPMGWDPATSDTIAGLQDLTYGDEILAAAPLLGSVYIYTRRAIWKMTLNAGSDLVFSFTRVYNEPKNQTGCLVYPNTLTSDGQNHWYASRDGFYRYNPYAPAPERDDWLHRASGVMFTKEDTKFDGKDCEAPIGEYRPATKELWFSWPSKGTFVDDWTLVAQTEQKTADIVDHGFTSWVNFRRTPIASQCNEVQDFIAASKRDLALKSLDSGVYYREFADITVPDEDIPFSGQKYFQEGFISILRGVIPLGLYDRDKIVREVLVDHDTTEQEKPCVLSLKVGVSQNLVDPNDTDDICNVRWYGLGTRALQCPTQMKTSDMLKKNLTNKLATHWPCYQRGRFVYFEIAVLNKDLSPALGGDTCFQRIDFSAIPLNPN